ncbi:hypothetical protein F4819DRAFT_150106 [Hypoxylon fuscum]|nr:hypothetical protein F4819DRAFT_150106 [Hypoxylon fuscum]
MISNDAKLIAYSPFAKPVGIEAGSTLADHGIQNTVPSSGGSSLRRLPISNSSRQNSPAKSTLPTTSPASLFRTPQKASTDSGEKSNQAVERSPVRKLEAPNLPEKSIKRQQPSVADLRKSFEQKLQQPGQSSQASSKSKLPGTASSHPIRNSKELPRSSGSTYRGKTPSVTTITRKGTTAEQTPPSAVRRSIRTELQNATPEQFLPTSYATGSLRHTPAASLPKSSRFHQKGTRYGVSNLDGAQSIEFEGADDREEKLEENSAADVVNQLNMPSAQANKRRSYASLVHPWFSPSSKSTFRDASAGERLLARETTGPTEAQSTPRPAPKSRTMGCTSKVSDIRKLFERSSTRASPNSIKSFWQNRNRKGPAVEAERNPTAGYDPSASSTTLATCTSPLRRIPTPEITTEISTNDFFCDFIETLNGAEPIRPRAHFNDRSTEETVVLTKPERPRESPVKNHIDRFERLDHGSPAPSPAPISRAKSYDANLHPAFREKENDVRQMKTRKSWQPFRQRSVELWRQISSSFARSVDGGNDSSDDGEQASSSAHVNSDSARPPSVRRRVRHHRSSFLGYHLSRTFELRSSIDSFQDESRLSINDELKSRFEKRPQHPTHARSPSSHLSMRRTFPFLARMSDGLGGSDEFDDLGLDGSVLSKATKATKAARCRDRSSTCEDTGVAHPSHGDPNALSRVVSQQTIAERKHRRLEEKQLRKEQRDKKREEKARGKGKGKEMGSDGKHDQGQQGAVEENPQEKGKGKETAGKQKKESSWSKKTASGFVVRQINDIKLKHPKPRRPGQVKKIVNMYKEKATSGIKLGKGSGVSSNSGAGTAKAESADHH